MPIDYSGFAFPKPRKRQKRTRHFADKVTGEQRTIYSRYGWAKMKRELWDANPQPDCSLCFKPIERFEDMEPDHRKPRGMGGGKRQDASHNIGPAHRWCNREKGSKRL